MESEDHSELPVIRVESDREPLSVNVVSRELNVVLVPENDLDTLADGGAIQALALAACGIFAGGAITLATTLAAADLSEGVRAAFVWAFVGCSLLAVLLLAVVVVLKIQLSAKIRAIKSGRRMPLSSMRSAR